MLRPLSFYIVVNNLNNTFFYICIHNILDKDGEREREREIEREESKRDRERRKEGV